MKRIIFHRMNEMAWVLGVILCALGVCLLTKAGFGLSMVAAPAYILHLKWVQIFPFFSQGTAEYVFQGVLLILLCIIIRKFNWRFLLSFVTAVIFGLVLDGWFWIFSGNSVYGSVLLRVLCFVFGELITALAIAFFFRTSWPLEIYELFVTEIARKFNLQNNKVKQFFDIVILLLSVIFAVFLNHSAKGLGIATVIIAFINAPLIAIFGRMLDRYFTFDPLFKKLDFILKIK